MALHERIQRLNMGLRAIGILFGLAVLAVTGVVAVIFGDGESSEGEAAGETTTTTMETGGIEVPAPEGWRAIPVPQFGFGVALPDAWEATVLSGETLADLSSASPVVPGFLEAAHAAAEAGYVFYAAGVDGNDGITDLKVRVDPDAGVTDVAGLEAYAAALADPDSGVADASITPVEGAAQPTVEVRYTVEVDRPVAGGEEGETERLTVQGIDHLVLGTRGAVYSLVVTGETADALDAAAPQIFASLTFPPA